MIQQLCPLFFWGIFLALFSCKSGVKTWQFKVPDAPVEASRRSTSMPFNASRQRCRDWRNYVPDPAHPEYQPKRYLRVNVHVMNSRDSSHNFKPEAARRYFRALIDSANVRLDTNWLNWRSPEGTPALPKGYTYVLWPQPNAPGDDGFYFHFDDQLYYFVSQGRNQNNHERKVIQQYGIGRDTIINMFALVHQEDSIKSKTYRATSQGIALGTDLKLAGLYELQWPPEHFAPSLNHEVGHILSLAHAWSEDGCPDTENHPNKCWQWQPNPPCDKLATDNMMDYNAYQIALTPCQLGRIHATLSSENNNARRCLIKTWCTRNPAHDVVIRDSVAWLGERDLEGNLTIAPGAALKICCRLSMPENSRITVQPGARLYLEDVKIHNDCNRPWQGILVEEKNKIKGQVFVEGTVRVENVPGQKLP